MVLLDSILLNPDDTLLLWSFSSSLLDSPPLLLFISAVLRDARQPAAKINLVL